MADLLIHSMAEFAEIIVACLEVAGHTKIIEIGSERGSTTDLLRNYVLKVSGHLTTIDPAPKAEPALDDDHFSFIRRTSLAALEKHLNGDAWLIDGDHNWYTVFNELALIGTQCEARGVDPLIFLHDVGWPCARRDMYYDPDAVPEMYRHPFRYDHGVSLRWSGTRAHRGFRGGLDFAYADVEGGERNGVLTAIEDFLRERDATAPWTFMTIPAVFGLGVLFPIRAAWADRVAEMLKPFCSSPLLERLERNRLENYLKVIELQDRRTA